MRVWRRRPSEARSDGRPRARPPPSFRKPARDRADVWRTFADPGDRRHVFVRPFQDEFELRELPAADQEEAERRE